MVDKKISELGADTTPLAGTELVPIVQSGSTVQSTALDVGGPAVVAHVALSDPHTQYLLESSLGANVNTFLSTPSSANLAAAVTDETGSGALVFATSPTLVTPALGTPSAGVLSNCTGYPTSALTGLGTNVGTFLATPSSANLAAALTDETGTGAAVFANTPTLVTPVLGVATATSINKVAITAPATSATLTIADGKTLTASNTLTLTATDGSTLAIGGGGTLGTAAYKTIGTSGDTVPKNDTANAFSAKQSITTSDGGSATTDAPLVIEGTSAGANGAAFVTYHNSASPAASDVLGRWNIYGRDSANNIQLYADIRVVLSDPTSTSEDAVVYIATDVAGTHADRLAVGAGVYHTSATGGDKGNNTLNFGTIYENNVRVASIGTSQTFSQPQLFITSGVSAYTETTSSTSSPLDVRATHASYTGIAQVNIVTRTATNAYRFAAFISGGGSGDTEFVWDGDGNARCDGAWSGGGTDVARMAEWEDGNPDNEDRRGWTVVWTPDGKIRPATANDDRDLIWGAVSRNYTLLLGDDWNKWKGKYLRDEWGAYVLVDYEVVEWVEERKGVDGEPVEFLHSYAVDAIPEGEVIPSNATRTVQHRRKLNPDFDRDIAHTPRIQRKEWETIGFSDVVRVLNGQPVGARWLRVCSINERVTEWQVR